MYSALSPPSIPRLRCPWARHRTPNCSPGAALAAHCSGCVFTAVCVHFGWVKCRAQIPSMGHHTWSYVTSLSFTFLWSLLQINHQIIYLTKLSIHSKASPSASGHSQFSESVQLSVLFLNIQTVAHLNQTHRRSILYWLQIMFSFILNILEHSRRLWPKTVK